MSDVYAQAKRTLGKEAVIIQEGRKKTGGFMGVGGKYQYTVTAEIKEENETQKKILSHVRKEHQRNVGKNFDRSVSEPVVPDFIKDLSNPLGVDKKKQNIYSPHTMRPAELIKDLSSRRIISKPANKTLQYNAKKDVMKNEDLKESIEDIREKVDEMILMTRKIITVEYPGALKPLYVTLIKNELERHVAEDLLCYLKKNLRENETSDIEIVEEKAKDWMKNKLALKNQGGSSDDDRIMAFVGPTGVGKTSTLVKLGANKALESFRCGFITFDNYRIAAIEQLKTYAEILGSPVKSVQNIKDIKSHIEYFVSHDKIYIDTAGRSPRNMKKILELKSFLNEIGEPVHTFLLMSATSRYPDIQQIMENFEETEYENIIFTKLDETSSLGPMLSIALVSGKHIPYITNGQNVPSDIEPLNFDKLINNVFRHRE